VPGTKPVIKNNGDYKADTFVSYVTREAAVTIPDGPLIIINKKLVDYKVLNNYSLQDVKDINVLARDASVEAYGPQGLHGAVLITLNKKDRYRHFEIECLPNEKSDLFNNEISQARTFEMTSSLLLAFFPLKHSYYLTIYKLGCIKY